ncbi:SDR family NAD(P)-dependent oxidoreductase [Paenibacillus peoriae]|uniref:SDR family NAD(P)-dependent oxidoreductase n=1 Tax=Paenibacillus peoriae TaxID=59893 RepID=UPI00096F028F|nr:SDR family oxidoreductase [Paenibacillus peoriae]KAF6625379.1 SDR family oxidoreductase [Paenibacillus sp. EKM208P]OMF49984.1 3-oxoacyl-ACP reductase [Paenibacillus peoriae]
MLRGKNAVITGCSRGIGKQTVRVFASSGANIWACLREPNDEFLEYIEGLSKEYNVTITPVYFDFSNTDQIKAAVKVIMGSKQTVDILVNNAGITYNALFQMTTMDKLREVFEINFFSQFLFTQLIVKLMVRQKSGSIVNISSSAALDGNAGRSAYGSSKAALVCMTKALAEELAEYNIRSNAIAPGITGTDMAFSSMTEEVIESTLVQTALKRIGQPFEIAQVALFLASEMSSYMTGQVIRVDGGM